MDTKCKFHTPFLILILIVNSFYISGQDIRVDLQIEWKKSINNLNCYGLKTKDSILIPYLKIIYKNNSNKPYYFKNIMINNKKYTPIGIRLVSGQFIYDCNKMYYSKDEKENYVVLGNDDLTNEFMLYSDTIKKTISLNNEKFSQIRTLFQTQNKLDFLKTGKKLKCFDIPNKKNINQYEINDYMFRYKDSIESIDRNDITEENISNKLKDYFVFLNPNETKEYEVNLIAFLIIGGNYNFSIDKKTSNSEISIPHYNEGKIIYKKTKLPLNIEKYTLYNGKLMSSSVNLRIFL